jgi:hypothetical protein
MSFEQEADDALKEMIDLLGSFWVVGKKTIRGMQSDKTDSNSVELTGLLPDVSFTVCFRKCDFDPDELPETGDRIKNSDEADFYRIAKVETSIGDPSLTIYCSSLDGK